MELTLALVALAVVLGFAMIRPRGWPEAVVAVPAAGLLIAFGVISWHDATAEVSRLLPVVGFLAAVLVLARLCDDEGLFRAAGAAMARSNSGSQQRLFATVFVIAAATTAILSLDATVVLLTPVVLATTRALRVPARPHAYATAHLANSASLLFPVRLRRCTDSMTGFFAVRRDAIDISSLQPRGFKILLEILVRHRVRIVEVPFTFADRMSGESKASFRQGLRFMVQLAQLRCHLWWATKRAREMASFGAVGAANVLLDIGIFNLILLGFRHDAAGAKVVSTTVATIASYFMNRHWTWRDRNRSGVHRELPLFALLSAVGLALAEACLWVSHDLLGYTSALADNIAANGVGLALGMVWRFLSFKRWVFTAPLVPAEVRAQPLPDVEPSRRQLLDVE